MGNQTNPSQWAAQERLRFIEKSAFWRGTVNRQDLQTMYGVSQAQSSSDLQKYLEINPGSLIYNLKRKRYEGAPAMACRLHEPQLEEALTLFLGAAELPFVPTAGFEKTEGAQVAGVTLPMRRAPMAVQRACFIAVLHQLKIRIHYLSLSDKNRWRWIAPHAFAHDGYRWHMRAWCEENGGYRDFVLGRVKDVDWPVEPFNPPQADTDWNEWVPLTFAPNPKLSAAQQDAIRMDYGMRAGKVTLDVRKAMLDYALAHLRLPASSGRAIQPYLVLVNPVDERLKG